jgi:selenocysteine lyase/cysteine desulfurase
VTWVRDRDGRIRIEDMKKAIRKGTKLVALSLVSTINGFEHDLKSVCDIAHANGALVYADIIHAAGCVPVDLHASGVDFAACATYKWLMGDFGLGFLYVRKDIQPQMKRVNYGYYGMSKFQPHIYPLDPPGGAIADYGFQENATGLFALGTHSHTVVAILNRSLDYIHSLGVREIQKHAQSLTDRLKKELPKRGYALMTPNESKTPMVACVCADARKSLSAPLKEANVKITSSTNRFRVSVSVFNGMDDIDRLMAVLPKMT